MRPTGKPQLRFKNGICKHDLRAVAINTDTWEALAWDRCTWRQEVQKGLSSCADTLTQQAEDSIACRKSRQTV